MLPVSPPSISAIYFLRLEGDELVAGLLLLLFDISKACLPVLSRDSCSLLPTHPGLSGLDVQPYPVAAHMLSLYAIYYPDLDVNWLIHLSAYL